MQFLMLPCMPLPLAFCFCRLSSPQRQQRAGSCCFTSSASLLLRPGKKNQFLFHLDLKYPHPAPEPFQAAHVLSYCSWGYFLHASGSYCTTKILKFTGVTSSHILEICCLGYRVVASAQISSVTKTIWTSSLQSEVSTFADLE